MGLDGHHTPPPKPAGAEADFEGWWERFTRIMPDLPTVHGAFTSSERSCAHAAYMTALSAPRKVWAVMYGDYGNRDQTVSRVYASREAAQNYIDAEGDEDTTITEYEVDE